MDIWITRCRKKARCGYCPEPILKGSPMVKGRSWREVGKEGKVRKWLIILRWHPQCWVEQGVKALEKQVYTEKRGRKRLILTDEVRVERKKIMVRYGAAIQRIRRELDKPVGDQSQKRLIHLGAMMNSMKIEIEPLGGAPKGWD